MIRLIYAFSVLSQVGAGVGWVGNIAVVEDGINLNRRHMTNHSDFADALAYAATLHAADVRKGTQIPYISHLIAVAGLVMEHGGNTDVAIAALLHDSLEDAPDPETVAERAAEIEKRFGRNVLSIVKGCTDGLPDDAGEKPPWRKRKEDYLDHLSEAPQEVLLVSCCDKLHNARAVLRDYREIGEELWTRFNGGRDGTLWYYRSVADTFEKVRKIKGVPPAPLVQELDNVVTDTEDWSRRKRITEVDNGRL